MAPNDEIKSPLKEKLYHETLDEFAQRQYNPDTDLHDCISWENMKKLYIQRDLGWSPYLNNIEKAVKLAIDNALNEARTDTAKQIFKEIDKIYAYQKLNTNGGLYSKPAEKIYPSGFNKQEYETIKKKYEVD